MDIIDKLLETPCYIMDFLPKQVPMNCGGQFFEVETYLLNHYDCCGLRVILSILVYTFFSRMFDLMLPPVAKHSIVVA